MKRYYLFPLLLFAAAFIVDKQFYIGGFERTFLRTASFINYEHKEELIDELRFYRASGGKKKILVLFGNSRTMTFDNAYIESRYPGWILYNFSVPGGTSDYYYYFMTQFKKHGIRPDFIYFTVSPQGFNTTPSIAMDEVMLNGLPVSFITKNFTHYSVDDLSNYFAKKSFWNYQYRPKLGLIVERLSNESQIRTLQRFLSTTHTTLIQNRGSVPAAADYSASQDPELALISAKSTWRDFLSPFHLSQNQVYFTDRCLKTAQELQIPSLLLWARVGPHLRRLKNETTVGKTADGKNQTIRSLWQPVVNELAQKRGSALLDMNYGETIGCDLYYDASHLAAQCFPDFTDYLFDSMKISPFYRP